MLHRIALAATFLVSSSPALAGSGDPALDTRLTARERDEVTARLARFYGASARDARGGPQAMDSHIPKFEAQGGAPAFPNPALAGTQGDANAATRQDPLLAQAKEKASPRFQTDRCQRFLKNIFPGLRCDDEHVWASIEPNDRVENLAATWIAPEAVSRDLDRLPPSGEVTRSFWSGDYWKMQWGLTSYRYAENKTFSSYRTAVGAYAQPDEWSVAKTLGIEALGKEILKWSPAEKYDLTVGDEAFTLTVQRKREGEQHVGPNDDVESWFGLCHGWAPAAIFVPRPKQSVTAKGPGGASVEWYADDVKAMATLAWANGWYRARSIGGRCNARKVKRYPNGRVAQPECFDNNPATLHAALGNLIGREGIPFVMDASWDYEVWNQPILAYRFQYFNPLAPAERKDDWRKAVVPYDDAFKARDRFQKPLTRGRRIGTDRYDDARVKAVVGVTATVVYLGETAPRHTPAGRPNTTIRATYTYDLELEEEGGRLVAAGGEWHENAHPDFLWLPEQGSVPAGPGDGAAIEVDLSHPAPATTTKVARAASDEGYPLCRVVEKLVAGASGVTTYRCPGN